MIPLAGMIFAGIDPLIAVSYQILVMLMLLGSGGLSAAAFVEGLRNFPGHRNVEKGDANLNGRL